jgi:hypothetical protein
VGAAVKGGGRRAANCRGQGCLVHDPPCAWRRPSAGAAPSGAGRRGLARRAGGGGPAHVTAPRQDGVGRARAGAPPSSGLRDGRGPRRASKRPAPRCVSGRAPRGQADKVMQLGWDCRDHVLRFQKEVRPRGTRGGLCV